MTDVRTFVFSGLVTKTSESQEVVS